mgnify:CR=1 FL=1
MLYLQTLLDELDINVTRFKHEAVFNCAQASSLLLDISGAKTKNLFLKDKKGKRHFLLVISDEKVLDFKVLAKRLNVNRLSFASDDSLKQYLKSEPGRVSLLDILKDDEGAVELFIDEDVWDAKIVQCHPYSNESTWTIGTHDIDRLFTHVKREYQFIPFL